MLPALTGRREAVARILSVPVPHLSETVFSQHSGVRPPAAFVTHCSAGTEPLIFTPSYLQLSEIIRWIVTCCGRGHTYVHNLLMKLVCMINICYLTYHVLSIKHIIYCYVRHVSWNLRKNVAVWIIFHIFAPLRWLIWAGRRIPHHFRM